MTTSRPDVMTFPTLADIQEACRKGELSRLRVWRAAGHLPNFATATLPRLPQVLAAENGQLDVLKWLVTSSGQPIDVTAGNNLSAQLAAANGHVHVLQWLVGQSNQPVDVTALGDLALHYAIRSRQLPAVRWLVHEAHLIAAENPSRKDRPITRVNVTSNANKALQLCRDPRLLNWLLFESGQLARILAVENRFWLTGLPVELQQRVDSCRSVTDFLEERGMPVDDRERYLQSQVCVRAIASGLVTTVQQLETLVTVEEEKVKRI